MDPNHERSDCIESINLDLSRSGKPKSSKIDHDAKGQIIPLQSRDCLSRDKQSDTSRQATNEPDVAPSEGIMREVETLNFHEHEVAKLDTPHDDALVITLELAGTIFSKIPVDFGSAAPPSMSFYKKKLRSISQPTPVIDHETTPLNSFEGKSVQLLGIVPLTTKTHDVELQTRFAVVDHFIPFDAIIGRLWLHQMRAVLSVYHQC
ncbi:hypothetical protein F2Q69_00029773 [Brassica cretica]|uniref:Uncharacterized protein n=1 Tax=Brassica cretica TaxID=69181 RepID=A0A8S9RTL9_BRACR|nr:hypothetical protein F2Q69_00029773 [Brassica cretica]